MCYTKFYPFGIREDVSDYDLKCYLTELRQLRIQYDELVKKIGPPQQNYKHVLYTWELVNNTDRLDYIKWETLNNIKELSIEINNLPSDKHGLIHILRVARILLSKQFCTDDNRFITDMNFNCNKQDIIDIIEIHNKFQSGPPHIFKPGFNETDPDKLLLMYNLLHSEEIPEELKVEYYLVDNPINRQIQLSQKLDKARFNYLKTLNKNPKIIKND